MGFVKSFFGGAPKVSTKAVDTLKDDQTDARKARQAMFAEVGDAVGQELQPGQVKQRGNLFGN